MKSLQYRSAELDDCYGVAEAAGVVDHHDDANGDGDDANDCGATVNMDCCLKHLLGLLKPLIDVDLLIAVVGLTVVSDLTT